MGGVRSKVDAESTDTMVAEPQGGLRPVIAVPFEESAVRLAVELCKEALAEDPSVKGSIGAFGAVVDMGERMNAKLADAVKASLSGESAGDSTIVFGVAFEAGPAARERILRARGDLARERLSKVANVANEWEQHVRGAVDAGKPVSELGRHWLARLCRLLATLRFLQQHVTLVAGDVVLRLRSKDLSDARGDFTADDVLDTAAALYSSGALSFPWKRMFIGSPDDKMAALRKHRLHTSSEFCEPQNIRFRCRARSNNGLLFPLRFEGGFLTFVHERSDYDTMDVFADTFQEGPRLVAKREKRCDAVWAMTACVSPAQPTPRRRPTIRC